MAFVIKNTNAPKSSPVAGSGQAFLDQAIHVTRGALVVPQSTTEQLFLVKGGRVRIKGLVGEVTTIMTATDPVMKVSSQKLDAAQTATVGTAVDVASTVDISSLEVGGFVFVEGDGTAAVKSNAGAAFIGTNSGQWVAPAGQIYITTTANNVTGQMKWDLWYQPLDEGAFVVAVSTATTKI